MTTTQSKFTARANKAWVTRRQNPLWKKSLKSKSKDKVYDSEEKAGQRQIFIKLLKESLDNNNFKDNIKNHCPVRGIYLESPELLFTKLIQKENLNSQIMFRIPNNIDFNKFGGQSLDRGRGKRLRKIDNGILLKDESYKEMIGSLEKNTFNHCFIWADYCGTFSSYKDDIEETFKKRILGNNSIFGVTFCTRDKNQNQHGLNKKVIAKSSYLLVANAHITNCAHNYGYYAESVSEGAGLYKQNMYTLIFKITLQGEENKRFAHLKELDFKELNQVHKRNENRNENRENTKVKGGIK